MSKRAATMVLEPAPHRSQELGRPEPVDRWASWAGVAPIWFLAGAIVAVAVARFLAGRTAIDLPIFDQGLWAASRGRAPFSTVVMENLLGDHFGPGLLAFVPFYRLWANPIWLLAGQGLAAGAAVHLIVGRLRPAVGGRSAALTGLILLASPPVAHALLFDAHGVVFATPFALAAIFAAEDGRDRAALCYGLLAASFRVEVGLAVLVAYLVAPERRPRVRAIAAQFTYLAVAFVLESKLGHSDSHWPVHFGHLGSSAADALVHPWRILANLLSAQALWKAIPWLMTAGGVCLLRPRRMVPAFVAALPVLLSQWGGTSAVEYHYGIAPALLLAVAWVPAVTSRPERLVPVVLSGVTLLMLAGPLNPSILYRGRTFAAFAAQHAPSTCLTEGIPASAGVSGVQQPLGRLAHREHLFVWPFPFAGTPADVLPSPDLAIPRPELTGEVDYLIVPAADTDRVPPGFVEDTRAGRTVRFRREATTSQSPSC